MDVVDITMRRLSHVPFILSNNQKMVAWSDIKEIFLWCANPQCKVVLNALKCLLGYPESERSIHPCSQLEHLLFLKKFVVIPHGTLLINVNTLRNHEVISILHQMVVRKHAKSADSNIVLCAKLLKEVVGKYSNTSFKVPFRSLRRKKFLPAVSRAVIRKPVQVTRSSEGFHYNEECSSNNQGCLEQNNIGKSDQLVPSQSDVHGKDEKSVIIQTEGPLMETTMYGTRNHNATDILVPLSLIQELVPSSSSFLTEMIELYLLGRCVQYDIHSICKCDVIEGMQLTRFLASQYGYDERWHCVTSNSLLMSWAEFWRGYTNVCTGMKIPAQVLDFSIVTLDCQVEASLKDLSHTRTTRPTSNAENKSTVPKSSSLTTLVEMTENVHEHVPKEVIDIEVESNGSTTEQNRKKKICKKQNEEEKSYVKDIKEKKPNKMNSEITDNGKSEQNEAKKFSKMSKEDSYKKKVVPIKRATKTENNKNEGQKQHPQRGKRRDTHVSSGRTRPRDPECSSSKESNEEENLGLSELTINPKEKLRKSKFIKTPRTAVDLDNLKTKDHASEQTFMGKRRVASAKGKYIQETEAVDESISDVKGLVNVKRKDKSRKTRVEQTYKDAEKKDVIQNQNENRSRLRPRKTAINQNDKVKEETEVNIRKKKNSNNSALSLSTGNPGSGDSNIAKVKSGNQRRRPKTEQYPTDGAEIGKIGKSVECVNKGDKWKNERTYTKCSTKVVVEKMKLLNLHEKYTTNKNHPVDDSNSGCRAEYNDHMSATKQDNIDNISLKVSISPKKSRAQHMNTNNRDQEPSMNPIDLTKHSRRILNSLHSSERQTLKIGSAKITDNIPDTLHVRRSHSPCMNIRTTADTNSQNTEMCETIEKNAHPTSVPDCSDEISSTRQKYASIIPKKLELNIPMRMSLEKSTQDAECHPYKTDRSLTECTVGDSTEPRETPSQKQERSLVNNDCGFPVVEGYKIQGIQKQKDVGSVANISSRNSSKSAQLYQIPKQVSLCKSGSSNQIGKLADEIVDNLKKQASHSICSVIGSSDSKVLEDLNAQGKTFLCSRTDNPSATDFMKERIKMWKHNFEPNPKISSCRKTYSSDFPKQYQSQPSMYTNPDDRGRESPNFKRALGAIISRSRPTSSDKARSIQGVPRSQEIPREPSLHLDVQGYGSSSSTTPDIYDEFARKRRPKAKTEVIQVKPKPPPTPLQPTITKKVPQLPPQRVPNINSYHTVGYISSNKSSENKTQSPTTISPEKMGKQTYQHTEASKSPNIPLSSTFMLLKQPMSHTDFPVVENSNSNRYTSSCPMCVEHGNPQYMLSEKQISEHCVRKSFVPEFVQFSRTSRTIKSAPAVGTKPFQNQDGVSKKECHSDGSSLSNSSSSTEMASNSSSSCSVLLKGSNDTHMDLETEQNQDFDAGGKQKKRFTILDKMTAFAGKCTSPMPEDSETNVTTKDESTEPQSYNGFENDDSELQTALSEELAHRSFLSRVHSQIYFKVPEHANFFPVTSKVTIPDHAEFYILSKEGEFQNLTPVSRSVTETEVSQYTTDGQYSTPHNIPLHVESSNNMTGTEDGDTHPYEYVIDSYHMLPEKIDKMREKGDGGLVKIETLLKTSTDFIDDTEHLAHSEREYSSYDCDQIAENAEPLNGDAETYKLIEPSPFLIKQTNVQCPKKSFKEVVEEKRAARMKAENDVSNMKIWNSAHLNRTATVNDHKPTVKEGRKKNQIVEYLLDHDKNDVSIKPTKGRKVNVDTLNTNSERPKSTGCIKDESDSKLKNSRKPRPQTVVSKHSHDPSRYPYEIKNTEHIADTLNTMDGQRRINKSDNKKTQKGNRKIKCKEKLPNRRHDAEEAPDDCSYKIFSALRRLSIEKSPTKSDSKTSAARQRILRSHVKSELAKNTKNTRSKRILRHNNKNDTTGTEDVSLVLKNQSERNVADNLEEEQITNKLCDVVLPTCGMDYLSESDVVIDEVEIPQEECYVSLDDLDDTHKDKELVTEETTIPSTNAEFQCLSFEKKGSTTADITNNENAVLDFRTEQETPAVIQNPSWDLVPGNVAEHYLGKPIFITQKRSDECMSKYTDDNNLPWSSEDSNSEFQCHRVDNSGNGIELPFGGTNSGMNVNMNNFDMFKTQNDSSTLGHEESSAGEYLGESRRDIVETQPVEMYESAGSCTHIPSPSHIECEQETNNSADFSNGAALTVRCSDNGDICLYVTDSNGIIFQIPENHPSFSPILALYQCKISDDKTPTDPEMRGEPFQECTKVSVRQDHKQTEDGGFNTTTKEILDLTDDPQREQIKTVNQNSVKDEGGHRESETEGHHKASEQADEKVDCSCLCEFDEKESTTYKEQYGNNHKCNGQHTICNDVQLDKDLALNAVKSNSKIICTWESSEKTNKKNDIDKTLTKSCCTSKKKNCETQFATSLVIEHNDFKNDPKIAKSEILGRSQCGDSVEKTSITEEMGSSNSFGSDRKEMRLDSGKKILDVLWPSKSEISVYLRESIKQYSTDSILKQTTIADRETADKSTDKTILNNKSMENVNSSVDNVSSCPGTPGNDELDHLDDICDDHEKHKKLDEEEALEEDDDTDKDDDRSIDSDNENNDIDDYNDDEDYVPSEVEETDDDENDINDNDEIQKEIGDIYDDVAAINASLGKPVCKKQRNKEVCQKRGGKGKTSSLDKIRKNFQKKYDVKNTSTINRWKKKQGANAKNIVSVNKKDTDKQKDKTIIKNVSSKEKSIVREYCLKYGNTSEINMYKTKPKETKHTEQSMKDPIEEKLSKTKEQKEEKVREVKTNKEHISEKQKKTGKEDVKQKEKNVNCKSTKVVGQSETYNTNQKGKSNKCKPTVIFKHLKESTDVACSQMNLGGKSKSCHRTKNTVSARGANQVFGYQCPTCGECKQDQNDDNSTNNEDKNDVSVISDDGTEQVISDTKINVVESQDSVMHSVKANTKTKEFLNKRDQIYLKANINENGCCQENSNTFKQYKSVQKKHTKAICDTYEDFDNESSKTKGKMHESDTKTRKRMLKGRGKGKSVDENEDSDSEMERRQKEETIAAEGFIKTQMKYYQIIKNSSVPADEDNHKIQNQNSNDASTCEVDIPSGVPLHGDRIITKAIADAEKALEGTGGLNSDEDDDTDDDGVVIEDLVNSCTYQLIEDEDKLQLGGVAYFKDYTLPFVYINGYKYTPLKDVLTIFQPDHCVAQCTIPRKVLQKHKSLVKTFSTWDQVYKFELIKLKKGPPITTGDMLVKLDSLISLLHELISQIVLEHKNTQLKRSKSCDVKSYKQLRLRLA